MAKKRADIVLFEKGLVESREKGKRLIMEGIVFIGTLRVDKPGEKIDENAEVYIKGDQISYASRGGLKLEKAIEDFNLDLKDNIAMDIGASTGGFTDCMLQNGVKKVYALDVGYGQLDWKLRNDPRVVVMERTNIRDVKPKEIEDVLDFISIDVSFISLKLVLPIAKTLLKEDGELVALVKPQFEAGKERVGKKGIIRDDKVHRDVLESIFEFSEEIGFGVQDISYSPVTGAKGNIEFLIYLKMNKESSINKNFVDTIVKEAHSKLL